MGYTHEDSDLKNIFDVFGKFASNLQQEDDGEKRWLLAHCSNPKLRDMVDKITLTMLHVLDAVGRLGTTNGITLSKAYGFPKGTVSKSCKRLAALGLIRTEALPGNKKELHFRITPLGEELFELHAELHRRMESGAVKLLERYSPEELRLVAGFMEDMLHFQTTYLEENKAEAGPASDK